MDPIALEPLDLLMAAMRLQHYAWASDKRDRAGLEACFTPAATVWIGGNGMQPARAAQGRTQIADWVIERHRDEFAVGHVRRHLVAFPILTPREDHLLAQSYFTVLLRNGTDLHLGAMGWYEDELEKDGAAWRIRRRLLHIDAKRGSPAFGKENGR